MGLEACPAPAGVSLKACGEQKGLKGGEHCVSQLSSVLWLLLADVQPLL